MVRRDEKIKRLSSVPMFRACSRKDLAIIAGNGEQLHVTEGTKLTSQGAIGKQFFVVLAGSFTVTRDGHHVATLGPGDHFGELALLDGQRRDATVIAEAASEVLAFGVREFSSMLLDVPLLGMRLLAGLAHRIHELESPPG